MTCLFFARFTMAHELSLDSRLKYRAGKPKTSS
jgi:hypothetical protein